MDRISKTGKESAVSTVVTKATIEDGLAQLGLTHGTIAEVHASLSSFGYVVGGAACVVDALLETVGENGTILMAAQTGEQTDPSAWENPPALPSTWDTIREAMPPYDPENTPLNGMGAVAENFRHRPGAVCSGHPVYSYTAWGRFAKLMCNRQSLHFPLGEESPAARLYELKGNVLLLGTDFDTVTCMHLAEYRTQCRPILVERSPLLADGETEWRSFLNLDLDSSVFKMIRPAMQKAGLIRETTIGNCHAMYFSAVDAVDAATAFLERGSIYSMYR